MERGCVMRDSLRRRARNATASATHAPTYPGAQQSVAWPSDPSLSPPPRASVQRREPTMKVLTRACVGCDDGCGRWGAFVSTVSSVVCTGKRPRTKSTPRILSVWPEMN